MSEKVEFVELSGWLRLGIVGGWLSLISFLIGFFLGLGF